MRNFEPIPRTEGKHILRFNDKSSGFMNVSKVNDKGTTTMPVDVVVMPLFLT